ncbi:MAG: response regulator [Betaproteobacteria bacterium]|nr:response regulator [Betaproteobacteria bacterium]
MSDPMPFTPVDILLVEDNLGDAILVREALAEYKIRNSLHHVQDGEQAMDFLYRRGDHAEAPTPGLIFLDLNLPRKDGREVLMEVKSDPELRQIPVVVFTSSAAETDIVRSYGLHANCYVTKPLDLEQFMRVVQSIENFWLHIVRLPGV